MCMSVGVCVRVPVCLCVSHKQHSPRHKAPSSSSSPLILSRPLFSPLVRSFVHSRDATQHSFLFACMCVHVLASADAKYIYNMLAQASSVRAYT